MALVCHCRGEDIHVAAILKLQSFAEFCHRHGEVAHGNVRTADTRQSLLQIVLVHGSDNIDDKTTAREILDVCIRYEEMAIASELADAKALRELGEAACFHDRGVWLKKEAGFFSKTSCFGGKKSLRVKLKTLLSAIR